MFRKALLELLLDHPMSVAQIAHHEREKPRDIAEDLKHLQRSLRHDGYRLLVEPAQCRKCGFVFAEDKLTKPGKCPRCHGTWIAEPRVRVERR